MITQQNDIRDIFNILHDGDIVGYSSAEEYLQLVIEIPYLAERIEKRLKFFYVILNGCTDLQLQTWPSQRDKNPENIKGPEAVFKAKLWILDAEIKGNRIEVSCSQNDSSFDYCGGTLSFATRSAIVKDENGKEYTIDEIGDICESYWTEWEKKK